MPQFPPLKEDQRHGLGPGQGAVHSEGLRAWVNALAGDAAVLTFPNFEQGAPCHCHLSLGCKSGRWPRMCVCVDIEFHK